MSGRWDLMKQVAAAIDPLPFARQEGADFRDIAKSANDRKRRGTAYRKAREVLKVIEFQRGIQL